jgi:hypothetical protein
MWNRLLTVVAIIIAVIAVLVGAFFIANRPQLVTVNAPLPANFPADSFSHASFEALLKQYVDAQGEVDYERWHGNDQDLRQLDSYLAAISQFSPDATPDRFAQRSDALAYWLYAYNAYVIKSILAHWPLKSVTEVKAPIEARTGLGFFYQQRFLFGGAAYSLYAVENDKIRATYQDPRIHFVLNCASASCPVLRPELPIGDELEQLLQTSTIDFVSDPGNVRVDHERQRVVISTIFKWFRNDFLNDLRRRGMPADNGVLDYISSVAPDSLQADLQAAVQYEIEYADYDWAINTQD